MSAGRSAIPSVMTRRPEEGLARRGGAVELLRVPSALFSAVARLRGALYDRRLLSILEVETPVISVGNIVAGGTGKTPMVVWLARALAEAGRKPGVLSRGYRREAGRQGDEARLLARLLPGVPHVENPDRVAGATELERHGVDVILLDDGFQHRRLHRSLDVVLLDATRPWGLPAVDGRDPVRASLPRGLLRESPRALARADLVVVTRVDAVPVDVAEALVTEVQRWAPRVPIAEARHRVLGLRDPAGQAVDLRGARVDLVSGIGNPDAFEASARGLGLDVAGHRRFPDHHPFTDRDFAGLGELPVVTTAKDAARRRDWPFPVHVLEVEMEFTRGEEALHALLADLPESRSMRERASIHEGLHG